MRKEKRKSGLHVVNTGYLLALLLLLISYLITLYANQRSLEQANLVDHSNKTIIHLETILSNIKDGETSARGYVLMKDIQFLGPYYASKQTTDSVYNFLKNEITEGLQKSRLDTLKRLTDAQFGIIHAGINLFENNNFQMSDSLKVKTFEGKRVMDGIRSLISRMENSEQDTLRSKKDEMKTRFYSLTIVIMVSLVVTFLMLIFGFLTYRRENLARMEADERVKFFKRTVWQSQIEIQEQALQNIAQDIHDNIGQTLTLAKLNLSTIDTSFSVSMEEKILDTKQLVSQAIIDLRSFSHSISTDFISEMGLPRAIEHELELINKSGKFKSEFSVRGEIRSLNKKREIILFRIVQEVLNNIIKHSAAKKIAILIYYQNDFAEIKIGDDGKGFDPGWIKKNTKENFGLGIKSMSNRASVINAEFDIESSPGNGAIVTIKVPFQSNLPQF